MTTETAIEACDLVLKVPFHEGCLSVIVEGDQDMIRDQCDLADQGGYRFIPLRLWSPTRMVWAEHYIAVDQVAMIGPTKRLTVQGDPVPEQLAQKEDKP